VYHVNDTNWIFLLVWDHMFLVQELSASLKCVPILVINYKPLNKVLDDNTYVIPHKSSLVNRIARGKIFSNFDLK